MTPARSERLPSLHAASAQWYFSHPGVRFRPIDGTSCEVAVATRPRHRRELVETLRQGDLADAPTAGMGNAPPRPGLRMMWIDSSWSALPMAPKFGAERLRAGRMPVRPKVRQRIAHLGFRSCRGPLW